jgi:hypothetical protein
MVKNAIIRTFQRHRSNGTEHRWDVARKQSTQRTCKYVVAILLLFSIKSRRTLLFLHLHGDSCLKGIASFRFLISIADLTIFPHDRTFIKWEEYYSCGTCGSLYFQEALDQLCVWADKWGMVFNVGKCKVMHMGHQNPAFNYTMKGQVLEETKEEKDIGVTVTSNLKPTAQCTVPGLQKRLRRSWDKSHAHSTTVSTSSM